MDDERIILRNSQQIVRHALNCGSQKGLLGDPGGSVCHQTCVW